VTTDDGSLAPEVLPKGDTNVTEEEVADGDSAALIGPVWGVFPSTTVADDDIIVEESGIILGHPMLRALGDVSLDEAMGTARWALTQAQNVLRRESGGIVDEWWRLLLWVSMLKEVVGFLDMRDGLLNRLQTAINNRDRDSQKMLAEAKELCASVEARVNSTIKQTEGLPVRVCVIEEQEQAVDELEQKLQE
jgi:hypothetical protein